MYRATRGQAGAGRPFLLICAVCAGGGAHAADWVLTAPELARLDRREALLAAPVSADRPDGRFRAAIEIDAPA
jgi:hypothetical protein